MKKIPFYLLVVIFCDQQCCKFNDIVPDFDKSVKFIKKMKLSYLRALLMFQHLFYPYIIIRCLSFSYFANQSHGKMQALKLIIFRKLQIQIFKKMGTSPYSKEQKAAYHLDKKQFAILDSLLDKKPQLLNAPITKSTKHTLLMRAAFNSKQESVEYVLSKEPDINAVTPKGQTALGIAVKRKNLNIVKLLIEKGANPNYKNDQELSIIDYAILPGYFNIAAFLYAKIDDKTLKEEEQYEEIAKKYHYRYVNYQRFLCSLRQNVENIEEYQYLERAKIKLIDPVPDPRESWTKWLSRSIDAGETPMVERNSLPEELQPQNRMFGKMDIFFTNLTMIEGKRQVEYQPPKRQVMSEVGDLKTCEMFNVDQRDTQSAI